MRRMGCTGRAVASLSTDVAATREMQVSEQDGDSDTESGPPRGALIALIVVVVLVVGGLLLTRELHSMAAIQDCAASGRTNCAPISR